MQSVRPPNFIEDLVIGHALTTPGAQDIHISCPRGLVEILIAEFKRQFADNPDVEVYDWGWSRRFRLGYVVLSWKGRVPPEFERQLNADSRLEGHTVYDLPASMMVRPVVAGRS